MIPVLSSRIFGRSAAFVLLALLLAPTPRVAAETISNGSTPRDGKTVLEPTPAFELGGYSEADEELFGVVNEAAIDAQGNVFLLDRQLVEIRVFSPDGAYITTFGRQGEGPGELMRPNEIMVMPDGRIAVLHGRPNRVTYFTAEGGIGEDVLIGAGESMAFTFDAALAGDRLVLQRNLFVLGDGKQSSTSRLAIYDPQTGERLKTLVEQSEESDMSGGRGRVMITISDTFLQTWGAGADGRVYTVPGRDEYAINVYGPDGDLQHTITRDHPRVARPKEAIEATKRQRKAQADRMGMPADLESIPEFYPQIDSVHPRDDGELWVLPGSGLATEDPEALGIFDVYDADGHFVRQVEVRVPFDRTRDQFTIEGRSLIVFEEAIGAMRGGFGGLSFVVEGAEEDEDEEVEPLSIVRYPLD